ncbi:hypothetical protein [Saccharothrix sp. HUAS TT1]|uniref:hypothetical protein n=1 Tax=unclassified Saccharothrix TaxID=2593673 RepID=UPI00345C0DED
MKRTLFKAVFAFVGMLALVFGTTTPASAGTGGNRCLWINSGSSSYVGNVSSTQSCGTPGTYHIRLFAPGFDHNFGNFYYGGGNLYGSNPVNMSFPAGSNMCSQLWRHDGGGNYSNWGDPCVSIG